MSKRLEDLYRGVLKSSGATKAEPDEMDLTNTPRRIASMLSNELLSSYKPGALDALKREFTTFTSPSAAADNALVVLNNIPVYSSCAHHMLPFFGVAHVGYIPKHRVAGLSKIPRAVDFFSKKLQMQERLVIEIADFLVEALDPLAVLVATDCRHLCMEMRGVRRSGVTTQAVALRGLGADAAVRGEFYSLIRK